MGNYVATLGHDTDLQQQVSDAALGHTETARQPLQSFDLFLQAIGLCLFLFAVVVKGGR